MFNVHLFGMYTSRYKMLTSLIMRIYFTNYAHIIYNIITLIQVAYFSGIIYLGWCGDTC